MPGNYGNFSARYVVESVLNVPNNTWTALPTTAMSNRQLVEIYNKSEYKMYISYDSSAAIQYRSAIGPGDTRIFPIQDNLTLYGRSGGAGSVRLIVTEYR